MQKTNKARFGLTMSPELFDQIEKKRGLIPRATYIEHSMKQYFELQDARIDEVKFYDEILAMLPDEEKQEDFHKLRDVIGSIRTKIVERKSAVTPK